MLVFLLRIRPPPSLTSSDRLVPCPSLFGGLEWAHKLGVVGSTAPFVLQLYSEPLQKFRRAAQGHGAYQPPAEHRERVAMYFAPLPIWYEAFESAQVGGETHPLHCPPLEGEGVSSRGTEDRPQIGSASFRERGCQFV